MNGEGMIEFYPQIRAAHIGLAISSGALFLTRGLLVQFGAIRIARAAAVRYASYAVDTSLLTAALMLLTILPSAVFANGWLLAKLGLIVAYIVLGVFALRLGQRPHVRLACFLAALLAFAAIYAIARAHHPLGGLAAIFG